jgi:hypothetical protein
MYKAEARILYTDLSAGYVEGPDLPTWGGAYDDMSRRLSKELADDDEKPREVKGLVIRINRTREE